MPQSEKTATAPRPSLEGTEIEINESLKLKEALFLAFDYRGDVTLHFSDGTSVEGYLFRHDEANHDLHLFVKTSNKESELKIVNASTIRKISFTGEDTAFGKSWDDWAKKSAAQRKAEDAKALEKAKTMGHI